MKTASLKVIFVKVNKLIKHFIWVLQEFFIFISMSSVEQIVHNAVCAKNVLKMLPPARNIKSTRRQTSFFRFHVLIKLSLRPKCHDFWYDPSILCCQSVMWWFLLTNSSGQFSTLATKSFYRSVLEKSQDENWSHSLLLCQRKFADKRDKTIKARNKLDQACLHLFCGLKVNFEIRRKSANGQIQPVFQLHPFYRISNLLF